MKKSLVALAALAATSVFAQSSVTIDGLLDAGYQSIDYKGNKVNGIAGNGSSTSQINFRGVSDLGGGLKADFRFETDWNTASGKGNTGTASTPVTVGEETVAAASSFGNGEIRVGLAGGFGRVDLGSPNYNTLGTYLGAQPFGTAIGSGFRTFTIAGPEATSQVRAENALKYTTPTMSGFNATYYKSNKQTKATATSSGTPKYVKSTSFSTSLGAYDVAGTQEIGLNYANGPIAGSYSSLKQDSVGVDTGTTANTVNTLGLNYTMGAAKFFLLNQTNKTTTGTVATNNKAMTLSAMYTMGMVDLMVQSGSNKNEVTAKKSKLTGIGANYNLSKTAFIYLRNEKIDDAGATMNAAVTPATIKGSTDNFSRTGLGLVVKF